MLRRVRWFGVGMVTGVVAGAGTTMYSYVRWRESRSRLAPDQVSETVVGAARVVGRQAQRTGAALAGAARDAVAEGRGAMAEATEQINAELDRPSPRPGRGPSTHPEP